MAASIALADRRHVDACVSPVLAALPEKPDGWTIYDLARLGCRLGDSTAVLDLISDGALHERVEDGQLRYRIASVRDTGEW